MFSLRRSIHIPESKDVKIENLDILIESKEKETTPRQQSIEIIRKPTLCNKMIERSIQKKNAPRKILYAGILSSPIYALVDTYIWRKHVFNQALEVFDNAQAHTWIVNSCKELIFSGLVSDTSWFHNLDYRSFYNFLNGRPDYWLELIFNFLDNLSHYSGNPGGFRECKDSLNNLNEAQFKQLSFLFFLPLVIILIDLVQEAVSRCDNQPSLWGDERYLGKITTRFFGTLPTEKLDTIRKYAQEYGIDLSDNPNTAVMQKRFKDRLDAEQLTLRNIEQQLEHNRKHSTAILSGLREDSGSAELLRLKNNFLYENRLWSPIFEYAGFVGDKVPRRELIEVSLSGSERKL